MTSRPGSASGNQARTCSTLALMLAWVRITPLETPVVPPVYWSRAGSRAASTSARPGGPRARAEPPPPALPRLVLADAGAGRLALPGVGGQHPLEPRQLVQHRGHDHLADGGPGPQGLDPVVGQVEADQHLDP